MSNENLRLWGHDDLIQMITEQRNTIDALYADKRDQFAMAALTGLLSGRSYVGIRMDWSKAAYEFADAMMKAREATDV